MEHTLLLRLSRRLTRFSGRMTQIIGRIETGAVPILSADSESERLRNIAPRIRIDFTALAQIAIFAEKVSAQFCAE
jgi:hypothetical protein